MDIDGASLWDASPGVRGRLFAGMTKLGEMHARPREIGGPEWLMGPAGFPPARERAGGGGQGDSIKWHSALVADDPPQTLFGFLRERAGPAAARSDMFIATAARMSACNASSSILSPSWRSMARLTLPSRLALKRTEGSSSAAPLAKVSFTAVL